LLLSPEDVLQGIKSLNIKSAAGATGWSNVLIRATLLHSTNVEEQLEECSLVADLFNRMISGTLRSTWWNISRSVLIPKPSSDLTQVNWRPLGIGDNWYRLMGRCVLKKVATSMASFF
jgi:hypothetical protein